MTTAISFGVTSSSPVASTSPVARSTACTAFAALLIERAAAMLRAREPITLRSLVAGTGVSTMAVYTHFDGMDGLWQALRQEGFTRLGTRLTAVPTSDDPVCDLTALAAAYLDHALTHPDLYRVMFDASVDLEDLPAADATLEHLVQAARRGRDAGRFRADVVPLDLAIQSWALGHGLVSLVATGPLPRATLDHGPLLLGALFAACGDDAQRARASVAQGWHRPAPDDEGSRPA